MGMVVQLLERGMTATIRLRRLRLCFVHGVLGETILKDSYRCLKWYLQSSIVQRKVCFQKPCIDLVIYIHERENTATRTPSTEI